MSDYGWVVMRIHHGIEASNGMPVHFDGNDGIVGVLPVFRSREEAVQFCSGCEDVFELSARRQEAASDE